MKKAILILLLVIIVTLGIFFYYTAFNDPTKKDTLTISVVCTTTMISDLVKNIVGEHAHVIGLMGPGIDPHLYRARESDLHSLTHANIIFYNGLHLEGKMTELFEKMRKRTPTVALCDCLESSDLRATSFGGIYDPHIWSDVSLWIKAAHCVCTHMCNLDPSNRAHYIDNATHYIQSLTELDAYIKKNIALISPENRTLITAHDAFGYFGQAYNITVIGLQGVSTDSEPGTLDIYNLTQLIIKKKIHAIFTETSIPERTMLAVKQAVDAAGWSIKFGKPLYSDALGSPNEPAGTYVGMMRYNTDAIVEGLASSHETLS